MKNSSTIKSSSCYNESPKTPGGISKSLLTPCRRVGLSRNVRKSGASPFQSPLSTKNEIVIEKQETRKRKKSLELTPQTPENVDSRETSEVQNDQTPTRKVELPRRKKSKTLIASIYKDTEENVQLHEKVSEQILNSTNCVVASDSKIENPSNNDLDSMNNVTKEKEIAYPVTPLKSLKTKSRTKKNVSPTKSIPEVVCDTDFKNENYCEKVSVETKPCKQQVMLDKSPNDLTKECIVVIQKKIFKKQLNENQKPPTTYEKTQSRSLKTDPLISQKAFDSDDEPLICLSKENSIKVPPIKDEDEQDFVISKPIKKNIEENNLSLVSNKLKTKSKIKSPATKKNNDKSNSKLIKAEIHKPPDSDYSDDEDFFEKKRTILIRKSYDKISKPQKAKSTGSITQKDIDNIKARIETKKKLLLAKASMEDTKELRDLIKKWQKGCQDALMELMDLMKSKFPDKQNMEYSEILQNLKIPSSLVGYDSDNDYFLTPDDESIILAKLN